MVVDGDQTHNALINITQGLQYIYCLKKKFSGYTPRWSGRGYLLVFTTVVDGDVRQNVICVLDESEDQKPARF